MYDTLSLTAFSKFQIIQNISCLKYFSSCPKSFFPLFSGLPQGRRDGQGSETAWRDPDSGGGSAPANAERLPDRPGPLYYLIQITFLIAMLLSNISEVPFHSVNPNYFSNCNFVVQNIYAQFFVFNHLLHMC